MLFRSKEKARALEKHEAGTTRVIPIVLRPVDWESAPFHRLQALPTGAKAITTWPNRDEGWADVVKGIRKAIQSVAVGGNTSGRRNKTEDQVAEDLSDEGAKDITTIPSYESGQRMFAYKGHIIELQFRSLSKVRCFMIIEKSLEKLDVLGPTANQ